LRGCQPPQGDPYILHSYSQPADTNLDADDLATLGACLKPPKSWTCRARHLEANLTLQANSVATVINHDLYYSLQKILP